MARIPAVAKEFLWVASKRPDPTPSQDAPPAVSLGESGGSHETSHSPHPF